MNQPINAEFTALLASAARTASTRVFPLIVAERKLWIKTAGPPRRRSSILLQAVLAMLFGLALLKPPRHRGGAAALAAEAAALRRLAAAEFPVPEVVACVPQWLVLSDAGSAVEASLSGLPDENERWHRIEAAGLLLTQLHRSGLWHGGAQIRNFSWCNGRPGLLDLEDHDLPGMSLAERQARDLLLFLYPLTRYDRDAAAPRLSRLAAMMLDSASRDTRAALGKFFRRTAWLIALARWIEPYAGRDVRQAVAAHLALRATLGNGSEGRRRQFDAADA